MPEHGEYFLQLRSDFVSLASIAPPKGETITTLYTFFLREEAVELLLELGADPSHIEAIPDADFLTAREREWTPAGLRFFAEASSCWRDP